MRTIPNRAKRRDKDNKEYIFKRSLFVRGDLCCMRLRCDLNPRLVGWLVFTRTICSQYVLIYFYLIYFVKFKEIKNTIDTHEPNVRWAKFLADHKKLYLSSARYKVKSFSL